MGIYSLYGGAAVVVFMAGVGAYNAIDRSSNFQPAKASVFMIDRKCDILETTKKDDGTTSARGYNGDCKSVDDWAEAKKKRDKTISGKAVVKVTYVAPQDGSSHTSELKFTSRDSEFYDLKAGDEIDILVRNDNPDEITKA